MYLLYNYYMSKILLLYNYYITTIITTILLLYIYFIITILLLWYYYITLCVGPSLNNFPRPLSVSLKLVWSTWFLLKIVKKHLKLFLFVFLLNAIRPTLRKLNSADSSITHKGVNGLNRSGHHGNGVWSLQNFIPAKGHMAKEVVMIKTGNVSTTFWAAIWKNQELINLMREGWQHVVAVPSADGEHLDWHVSPGLCKTESNLDLNNELWTSIR